MDSTQTARTRVAIIGCGFGGIGMGYYLKQAGIDDFVILEKGQDVGGTWRENTYPGAACDIPSHLYSYSFEPHYPWSNRYAPQPEILDYIRHCARKHDLLRHVRFGAEVRSAAFDQSRSVWTVTLANGARIEADTVVSAVGQLHRPAIPNIPGLDRFQGKTFHSATWDHGYDLAGKTVAVIGTGASAIQFVPAIAPRVARMHVFQRSPGWIIPKFDRQFSRFERWLLDTFPILHDLDRWRIYGITELLGYAYEGHKWAERLVTGFSKLMFWLQVRDPALRRKLTPDYPIGCKRILLTHEWLPTLQRPNVELVTDAVTEITPTGVRTADGRLREVDTIIWGTGFAATQFLAPMKVTGRDGLDLHANWQHGAEAYLGMAVAGFPNFFMLYGPNTNLGSGSIIFMLECQQRYIVSLLQARERQKLAAVEVTAEAQADYVAEIRERSARTTYEGGCHSWYTTADGRNTNNWIGLQTEFRRRTAALVLAHYRLTPITESAPALAA
ncbi:NAD(P)/FAD-dependent oxidoreductase [Fontimonas sp. SYSU GA230001]|uniref:flavin-containing monooxygenase n=1 Tax=Fontimonas sp. SYSU GA230001 TaxID=3142450 RepID=UPI0032B3AEC9